MFLVCILFIFFVGVCWIVINVSCVKLRDWLVVMMILGREKEVWDGILEVREVWKVDEGEVRWVRKVVRKVKVGMIEGGEWSRGGRILWRVNGFGLRVFFLYLFWDKKMRLIMWIVGVSMYYLNIIFVSIIEVFFLLDVRRCCLVEKYCFFNYIWI